MGHALEEDDLIRWSEFQILIRAPGREQSSTDIPTMLLDASSHRNRDGRIQPCRFEKRRSVNSSAAACGCSRTNRLPDRWEQETAKASAGRGTEVQPIMIVIALAGVNRKLVISILDNFCYTKHKKFI